MKDMAFKLPDELAIICRCPNCKKAYLQFNVETVDGVERLRKSECPICGETYHAGFHMINWEKE